MKIKRSWLICSVLLAAGLLATSALASKASTSSKAARVSSAQIVMVRVSGDPFYKTLECAARAEAKKLGVQLQVQGTSNYQVAEQTRVLDAVIATKPKVIMTAPVDPNGVIPVFKQVKKAGIKMVTFDTTLNDPSLVQTQVITNNYQQGVLAADALAKAIGDKGNVFVLSDMPGVTTTGAEAKGFSTEIKKFPKIKNLGTQYHNNDQNRAVSIVNSELSRYPNLAGVFTTNTFGSQAAATAAKQSHVVGKLKIVAYDTTPDILAGLKAGVYSAVVAYQARDEGKFALDAAVKLTKGEPVKHQYLVGNAIITQANLAKLGPEYVYVTSC